MKIHFLSISLILCCFSCNANKKNNTHKDKPISYILERDTITSTFFIAEGFYENDSDIYFYGLKNDTIYLYKENAKGNFEFDSYLRLPKQYTENEDIYGIKQLVFINMDSIIIFHDTNLALFSTKQDSLLKIFYHSRRHDWYDFIARGNTFLRWNKKRNTLPMIIFQSDYDKRTWLCDTEFLAEFSFEKDTYSVFPVKYPYYPYNNISILEYYSSNNALFAFNGDTFVFSFQITPITYLYDAKSGRRDSLFLQNSMYVPLPEPDTTRIREISLDNSSGEAYLEHNFYTSIVYDEYNKVYYRFFNKYLPRRNAEGLLNTWEDKEFGLTVLDSKLQIIGDVSWLWSWQDDAPIYYPTSKGLYGCYYNKDGTNIKRIFCKIKLIYEK